MGARCCLGPRPLFALLSVRRFPFFNKGWRASEYKLMNKLGPPQSPLLSQHPCMCSLFNACPVCSRWIHRTPWKWIKSLASRKILYCVSLSFYEGCKWQTSTDNKSFLCICPLNWGWGGIKLANSTLMPSVSSVGFSRHLCCYRTCRSHVAKVHIPRGSPGCQISCLACWWPQHVKPGHARGFEFAAQRVGYSEEGSEGL